MRRKRIVAGLLALSLALLPMSASAMSYRGKNYCCKGFSTKKGSVTGSVKYNAGTFKDTVKCYVRTTGSIGIEAKCYYHETQYTSKTLVDDDTLLEKNATQKVSKTYRYGKLSLTGDTQNTLYADE